MLIYIYVQNMYFLFYPSFSDLLNGYQFRQTIMNLALKVAMLVTQLLILPPTALKMKVWKVVKQLAKKPVISMTLTNFWKLKSKKRPLTMTFSKMF